MSPQCFSRWPLWLALLLPTGLAAAPLTLDDFIQTILDHNPGVQRILAAEGQALGRLQSSLGADDPLLNASGGLARTEPDRISGLELDRSHALSYDLGLERTYTETGTRLNLAYSNQYVDREPAAAHLGSSYYQPSLTLRLTQPLLKNAGGLQDRLDITLSELNLQLTRLQNRESLESYVTRLAALYLDWYQAGRETEITRNMYQQVKEQEELVALKVRREISEPHELLRVQETREDYYARWQQALGRYQGLGRQLQIQMNAPAVGTDTPAPGQPRDSALFRYVVEPAADDYLAGPSRLQAILALLREREEHLLEAKRDAGEADLNLALGYTRHGADNGLLESHIGSLNRNDYSLMLEYRYPLGNRKALGEYQGQLASRQQVQADTAQQLLDARAALANLRAQAQQQDTALAALERKIALAERKLKEERRLFRIGELDLFELLQDQNALLESRLSREQLYVQRQSLQLSIGELLDRNLAAFHIPAPTDFPAGFDSGN